MNAVKHTPGPWLIFPHTNGRLGQTVAFPGTEEFTATDICEIMPEDEYGEAIRVADANAQLIAAAPELADALRATLHYVEALTVPSVTRHRVIESARAALAKAGL